MSAALSFRRLFQLLTGSYGAFTEIFIHNSSLKYRVYLVDENSEMNLKWGSVSMFLHFAKIKRSLPKIIENWESLQNKLSQVIDILIMEHSNHSLSPEVRFLNVSRALETFHRKRRTKFEKDEALSEVVKSIMTSLPKKYKEKIGNSLNFVHEPTLRERVTELNAEFKKREKYRQNINSAWITKFVKSRNYYTHFGTMTKEVQTGDNLKDLSNQARVFLYLLVAKELGVTEHVLSEGLWYLILI